MKTRIFIVLLLAGIMPPALQAAPPPNVVNYQGRVMDNGVAYDGIGYFKFALCDQAATTTYWSNSSSSFNCGEPATYPAAITVERGLYSIQLGDGSPGMDPFPSDLFSHGDLYLRVWFSRDGSSFEQLDPLQPVTSVFNAMNAGALWGLTPGDLGGGAMPSTIIVAPSGGNTTTLKGGLMLADGTSTADLVLVAPGNYYEDFLTVPSNVTLRCIVPKQCMLQPSGGMGFNLMGHYNITIEGFYFTNAWEAIHLDGGESMVQVLENDFQDCTYGVNGQMAGYTIDDIMVRRNRFMDFLGSDPKGVALSRVNMAKVEDNIFSNLSGSVVIPVEIKQGMAVTVRDNFFGDNQGYGGGSPSSNIMITDSTFSWIENNRMKDPLGYPMQAIAVYGCNHAHIGNNDIGFTGMMPGGDVTGIYAETSTGVYIDSNRIVGMSFPQAVGIGLADLGSYQVVDNELEDIGDPYGGPPSALGIIYQFNGMPPLEMNGPKQIIKDNRLERCDYGITLDYSMMPEMMPFADKVIQGNIILDGDSAGDGIDLMEAEKVQVIDNKVVNYDTGLLAQYIMATPELSILRNEFRLNSNVDLDASYSMSGVFRVFYNFMDVYNRPLLPASSIEAYNVNSTGGTP